MSNHRPQPAKVVPLLQPGSFVRLDNQPCDLPPFQVLYCLSLIHISEPTRPY